MYNIETVTPDYKFEKLWNKAVVQGNINVSVKLGKANQTSLNDSGKYLQNASPGGERQRS